MMLFVDSRHVCYDVKGFAYDVPNTITGNDGYPQHRRRSTEDGGKTAIIKKHNGTTIEVGNQCVVHIHLYYKKPLMLT